MTFRLLAVACWLGGLAASLVGQSGVYIQRFVPGSYLTDNRHRVELRNASRTTQDLTHYLVVTRDYSVRLRAGTRLKPGEALVITQKGSPGGIALDREPDMLVRLYRRKVQGNYVALLRPDLTVVDAFYHSQLPNVPFLPDEGELILSNGRPIRFRVPPENNPVWGYFQFGDDPAVGYARNNGRWGPVPAETGTPPTAGVGFQELSVRFAEESVILKWTATNEAAVRGYIVERGTEPGALAPIGNVLARGENATAANRAYTFYDTDVQPDQRYYYRLKPTGGTLDGYSRILEVETRQVDVPFWLDVFPRETHRAVGVGIRFFTAYTQRVKIRILDERRREVALLYQNLVFAETQNLLKLAQGLPAGVYLVEALTETQRYTATLRILP